MEGNSIPVGAFCESDRYVELKKAGHVIKCPACGKWIAQPRGRDPNTEKMCNYCDVQFEIREFEGETYEEAVQKLEAWDRWRQNHSPFCQQLGSRDRECTSHMTKQACIGHYIHSVFENDLEWLDEQQA